jgi:hypothetical protein
MTLSVMTFCVMILSIMTFCTRTLSIMTFCTMTLSIMINNAAPSITTLSIKTHNIQTTSFINISEICTNNPKQDSKMVARMLSITIE